MKGKNNTENEIVRSIKTILIYIFVVLFDQKKKKKK